MDGLIECLKQPLTTEELVACCVITGLICIAVVVCKVLDFVYKNKSDKH